MAFDENTAQSRKRFKIDWVLINELAIGPAPRTDLHLEKLKAAGIRSILSLSSLQLEPIQWMFIFQLLRIIKYMLEI